MGFCFCRLSVGSVDVRGFCVWGGLFWIVFFVGLGGLCGWFCFYFDFWVWPCMGSVLFLLVCISCLVFVGLGLLGCRCLGRLRCLCVFFPFVFVGCLRFVWGFCFVFGFFVLVFLYVCFLLVVCCLGFIFGVVGCFG